MEMTDWIDILLIVSLPSINIKHKYELTSQETISFNQPIIFW